MFGQKWHGALDLKLNNDKGLRQGRVAHGPDLRFFFSLANGKGKYSGLRPPQAAESEPATLRAAL